MTRFEADLLFAIALASRCRHDCMEAGLEKAAEHLLAAGQELRQLDGLGSTRPQVSSLGPNSPPDGDVGATLPSETTKAKRAARKARTSRGPDKRLDSGYIDDR